MYSIADNMTMLLAAVSTERRAQTIPSNVEQSGVSRYRVSRARHV